MDTFLQNLKVDTNNDNLSRFGQIKISGVMNNGQSDVIFNTKIPSPFTIYAEGATPTEVQCNAGTNDVIFTPDIASEPFTLIISPSYGAEYLLKDRFTYTYYNLNEFGWFDVTKFKNASFSAKAGKRTNLK